MEKTRNYESVEGTEYLKCNLTEFERRDLAEKMALCISRINETEGTLKSVQTQLKSEITKYQAELTQAAERFRSGFEMRNVDIVQVKDFDTNTVFVRRLDTMEIVRERAMTGEERQTSLFTQPAESVAELQKERENLFTEPEPPKNEPYIESRVTFSGVAEVAEPKGEE